MPTITSTNTITQADAIALIQKAIPALAAFTIENLAGSITANATHIATGEAVQVSLQIEQLAT